MNFQHPKILFDNYNKIRQCRLVKNKDYTDSSLSEFEQLLNSAQPQTDSQFHNEQLIKSLYRSRGKDEAFLNLIQNSSNECLVLWTESRIIVRFFRWYKIIYIQYDNTDNKYKVLRHRNVEENDRIQSSSYKYTNISNYPTLSKLNVSYNNKSQTKIVSSLRDKLFNELMSDVDISNQINNNSD
jgi:hypothetical protein